MNASYPWYVVATDNAGNTGQSILRSFVLNVPLLATATLTGTHILYTGYTNDYVPLVLWTNKAAQFSITGDLAGLPIPYTGTVNASTTYNLSVATGSDGLKRLYITFSTGSETTGITYTITLDTTAPTAPVLTSPINGNLATGGFALTWNTSTDTGVGLSGYYYFISTGSAFATLSKTGFVTGTTASIVNMELADTGTFYWYVLAKDKFGYSTSGAYQSFVYSGVPDYDPDAFTFSSVSDANLHTSYLSASGTITGLSLRTQSLASINK